jgi:hypothetical protein
MKPIFGPHTPRLLQFLTSIRKLSPAAIDLVTRVWNEASPLDRALARAHLQLGTAANEEYPIIAAASAARRAAMETARRLGRDDWAFWAAAWDAGAAITADGLAEGDYQTLTCPLRTVMPALRRAEPGQPLHPGLIAEELPSAVQEASWRDQRESDGRQRRMQLRTPAVLDTSGRCNKGS